MSKNSFSNRDKPPPEEPMAVLTVRVQPRASRSAIVGWREGGVLAVAVTAPPVEGAANEAVREFLAEALGVRRGDVEQVSGQKSREKRFCIRGLTDADVSQRLTPG